MILRLSRERMDRFEVLWRGRWEKMTVWAKANVLGLFIFNAIILAIVLLRSVGYFAPFLPLGVNATFLIALLLAVVLFNGGSKFVFGWGLAFWILAGFFRVAGIDVWAERAAIYTFEALVVGVVMVFVEEVVKKRGLKR